MIDRIKSSPDTFARENGGIVAEHSPFIDSGSHEQPPPHTFDAQQLPCTSSLAQISPHEISMSSFHLQEIKKSVSMTANDSEKNAEHDSDIR